MIQLNRLLSRYGRPLLMCAWFYALAGLLPGRAYKVFLRPEFGILLVVALLVLIGFLFAEMSSLERKRTFGMDGAIRMLLLIAPLVYLPIARGTSLDSRAFQHRWTDINGTNIVSRVEDAGAIVNPAASSTAALEVTILDLSYDPDRYQEQRIAVLGMIHRDPKLKERFGADACFLFRFVINCCAADAQPVAILLCGDVPADLADDTWIRAEGRFTFREEKAQPMPTLEISKATRSAKPREPYLY